SIRALWVRTAVLVVLLIVVGRTVHVGPFATPRWTDSSGLVASTKHDEGPAIPFQHPGPNHCGLGHVTFIAYECGDYVQDPPAAFALREHPIHHVAGADGHERREQHQAGQGVQGRRRGAPDRAVDLDGDRLR